MDITVDDIIRLFDFLFFTYATVLIIFYLLLSIFSMVEAKEYMKKNAFVNYKKILSSDFAPSISIIAPAYNESLNIIENVRSLLSNHYSNYEVILVNDGSKDDSLDKLIKAYDLVKTDIVINEQIKTKPLRAGIFKSTNKAFNKLIVVDKENGGKSDALNVGLNVSNSQYVACIDVDCLLLEDSLQKLIKPALEATDKVVIAAGGVIRTANSCIIKDGKLLEVNLPDSWIVKGQILEYIRSFLLGRMAWARLNGLLVISGAFGLLDKKIAIEVGGYDTKTVGEDMEIIVRMRAYMHQQKIKYQVAYIPDPLCWTEVPDNYKILKSQRNRWTRGTIEVLKKHRNIAFNPRYGVMGMLSYPYWFFFERLAPLIEVLGGFYIIILVIIGHVNWFYMFSFFTVAYLFSVLFSIIAIITEELTYRQYRKKGMGYKLIMVAFLEPFTNHLAITYAAILGNNDYYFNKKKKWGVMIRKGMNAAPEVVLTKSEKRKLLLIRIKNELLDRFDYVYLTISLAITFGLSSLFETYSKVSHGIAIPDIGLEITYKLVNDFWSAIIVSVVLLPLFLLFSLLRKSFSIRAMTMLFTAIVLAQFALVTYSTTTHVNLGADLLGYSFSDMYLAVSSSETFSLMFFLPFIIIPLIFWAINSAFTRWDNKKIILGITATLFIITGSLKLFYSDVTDSKFENKLAFLINETRKFEKNKDLANKIETIKFKSEFPMLKPFKSTPDVLAPYFNITDQKPNIVFIVVEGLGAEFIGKNQYAGFTPYLDSMISKSLYWENFLSNGGRTYAVLPSLLGSLPYGEKGFLELNPLPTHLSLINVLKANHYTTSFYSGDDSSFDRKIKFLDQNGIDNVIDKYNFGSGFTQTQANSGGFSWGYPDAEIFKKALAETDKIKTPRLDIVQTLSNHEPFNFPTKKEYLKKIDNIIDSHPNLKSQKENISSYKDIFACLNYTDNSIKDFMEAYAKRPDYKNTIFIITGDHRLIPIVQKDKLCRFHVPLYIFSPMLKKSESFKSVSSHWDVTPSLVSFLFNNYNFNKLDQTAWMGKGLDTAKEFRNINDIPLTRNKGTIDDYVYKDYLYSSGELYKIKDNFDTEKINDDVILNTISNKFNTFKQLNIYLTQKSKIIPKSLNLNKQRGIQFSKEEQITLDKLTKGLNPEQKFALAKDLSSKNDYKTTLLVCDFILNELPNYADVRAFKARILARKGEYKKAETELLISIKRLPSHEDSYLALMDVYWWSGQNEKAIATGKLALSRGIKNPEISIKIQRIQKK